MLEVVNHLEILIEDDDSTPPTREVLIRALVHQRMALETLRELRGDN
jgi:hypothetical protein